MACLREKLTRAARQMPLALLAVITSALAAGGMLHLAGAGAAGDAALAKESAAHR